MRAERDRSFSYYRSISGAEERRPIIRNGAQWPTSSPSRHFYGAVTSEKPEERAGCLQAASRRDYAMINGAVPANSVRVNIPRSAYEGPIGRAPVRNNANEDDEDAINCSPCCDDPNISRTLKALLLGQLLSVCLCGTGVSSQLLANRNVNAPAAQSFTNYFLLCFVYCIALACRSDDDGLIEVLRRRGWRYFVLAVIDVEANYMIVKAYQYTNLTSVQLLDCATIPTVLLLSWLFLSVRYLASHIIGVTICLIGIACVIWADALGEKGLEGGSNKVLGDVLCLCAALLYAICNVAEEFLVKQHSRIEYLGMLGLFGCIVSGVQLALFEQENLAKITWDGSTIGYFALFAVSMFIFYSFVTVVLQKTSALMFNLSTLTADFYSLLFGIFLFQETFHYLYFVSFAICIIGSIVYSMRETQVRDADEPRRVCPCLFICCCCCGCCFEDGDSTEGSLTVSPTPNERMQMGLNPLGTSNNCPVHGSTFSRL